MLKVEMKLKSSRLLASVKFPSYAFPNCVWMSSLSCIPSLSPVSQMSICWLFAVQGNVRKGLRQSWFPEKKLHFFILQERNLWLLNQTTLIWRPTVPPSADGVPFNLGEGERTQIFADSSPRLLKKWQEVVQAWPVRTFLFCKHFFVETVTLAVVGSSAVAATLISFQMIKIPVFWRRFMVSRSFGLPRATCPSTSARIFTL